MTLSNGGLAQRFVTADSPRGDRGEASRMRIDTIDGTRVVIGYGWAIYAAWVEGWDEFLLFGDGYASDDTDVGWAGYSGPTTGHIQKIKGALEFHDVDFTVVDARPSTRTRGGEGHVVRDADGLYELASENAVDPQEYTGYFYRKEA